MSGVEEGAEEEAEEVQGTMANGSAADEEAALSDFEEDDLEAAPVVLPAASGTLNDGLKAAMAELEQERLKVRALEAAKAEGDANYTRMKAYAQETARRRDEALRAKEEISKALEEAMKEKEELSRQRDEFLKQRDEYSKARDTARAEIESTARLLIAGAEKVTSMVNGAKNFARSLPSSKYTGLAAIAYGFGKRMEEIVDEVVKQRDAAVKTRQETREQMEQRNYSIAIEVSELEASIMQLNEEVRKKNADINIWQKSAASKDERIVELENAFSEKIALAANQAYVLGQKADEAEGKNKILTEQLNSQTELFSELSRYVAKMKKGLLNLLPASSSSSSLSDSDTQAQQQEELASSSREASNSSTSSSSSAVDAKLQLPQQECLAGVKMLADLVTTLVALWNRKQDEWSSERQEFVSRIERLVAQKQGSAELLTVALAEKQEGLESISNLRVEVSQQQSEISRLQALLKEAQEKQVAEELTLEQSDTAGEAENVEIARLRVELTVAMQMRDEALSKVFIICMIFLPFTVNK
jgi:chromosome segregation ATPase